MNARDIAKMIVENYYETWEPSLEQTKAHLEDMITIALDQYAEIVAEERIREDRVLAPRPAPSQEPAREHYYGTQNKERETAMMIQKATKKDVMRVVSMIDAARNCLKPEEVDDSYLRDSIEKLWVGFGGLRDILLQSVGLVDEYLGGIEAPEETPGS